MLPVCVKRSRLYCSTIIFCNLIFKSASKLQLCPSSCLHGAWNACILWLKRDCSGQSHVIRQVVPPTLSIIKAIPPSSGTWYKVFTADRSFVWVTMLTYEEVFDKALDFLCMENNSNVVFFLWSPASLSNKIISMSRITIHNDMRCTLISFLESPEVIGSQWSWDYQSKKKKYTIFFICT